MACDHRLCHDSVLIGVDNTCVVPTAEPERERLALLEREGVNELKIGKSVWYICCEYLIIWGINSQRAFVYWLIHFFSLIIGVTHV